MNFKPDYVCCVPVSPLRLEPSHRSEMVTQQLFGETCTVTDRTSDHWIKVKCRYDGYEGWCQEAHLNLLGGQPLSESAELTAGYTGEVNYNGLKMVVPMGSSLEAIEGGKATWQHNTVTVSGETIKPRQLSPGDATIRKISFPFLNTSYLWGGKSIFGIDCSGFTQTVFKFLNVPVLRDAAQQATQGEEVPSIGEARVGDLAFFANAAGKIIHVGIMLGNSEIIHASVKVRIDRVDDLGIINSDTSERTHQLTSIRRYF